MGKDKTLKFTCPKCGEHVIECCMNGPHFCIMLNVYEDGIMEYGNYESEGELDRFQCDCCGFVIPVSSDEELAEWLKENCK